MQVIRAERGLQPQRLTVRPALASQPRSTG
jgi:hypothetical protein